MDEDENFVNVAGLIALRKTELYNRIIDELKKKRSVSTEETKLILDRISKLDNARFLTKHELDTRTIDKKLTTRDLALNIDSVIKEIGF